MGKKPEALLIYPPVYDFALYDLYLKPRGLLRIGRMLENAGWKTRLVNALDYREPETLSALGCPRRRPDGTGKMFRVATELPPGLYGIRRKFARYGIQTGIFESLIGAGRPDAVFISTGMTYWYKGAVEAAEIVRKIWPGVPLFAGGVYASLMPEHCARVCGPDYISVGSLISREYAAGQADHTEGLSRAGKELDRKLRSLGLPGISAGPAPGGTRPLDAPCWDDAAVLQLNEGCPLNCDYCASGKLSGGFRPGLPLAEFEWLKRIHEQHGTVNFAFYDDALLFSSGEVFKPFLEMVIEYRRSTGIELNFYSPNAMHIRFLDEEAAVLMKKAGFRDIRLGFESASETFHNEHDNKFAAGGPGEAVKLLLEAGFSRDEITLYVLAGLPGQTAAEVEDTIRSASYYGLRLSVSEFSPVPGSGLWPECVRKCRYPLEREPLYHNNSFFPMEWEGFTRDDMQRLKSISKQSAYSGF